MYLNSRLPCYLLYNVFFQRLARRLAFTERMENYNKGENIGKCVCWTLSGMIHIYKFSQLTT